MPIPVVDLHCDLPIFLALAKHFGEARTLYDRRSRCSLPQLREGGVALQTLAIFAPPLPDAVAFGTHQLETMVRVLEKNSDALDWVRSLADLDRTATSGDRDPDPDRDDPDRDGREVGDPGSDPRVGAILAVEGASTFAAEDEPLSDALTRFDRWLEMAGPFLYVGLTWEIENRFGGGNTSNKGLKPDGRVLLEYLAERGVPADLSHASPRLAHDILDFSYSRGLELAVLASHSPYAGVKAIPRNLPDEAAKEIVARGGIVGLNLVRLFVNGNPPAAFVEQLVHARELGILGSQALGADFFCTDDVPPEMRQEGEPEFFDDYADASCYPRLLEGLQAGLGLSDRELAAVAHGNVERFIRRVLGAIEK